MPIDDIILDPARDEMQLVHIPATILRTDISNQRTVWRGDAIVYYEYGTTPAAWVRWLIAIQGEPAAKEAAVSILHIEDGFCTLPRLLGPTYTHHVLYADPVMSSFAPEGTVTMQGDWTVEIEQLGTYDFILFNLGRTTTAEEKNLLVSHLKPGGKLLIP